ncbi:hypothetical protein DCAR_0414515 [Daucus carota subsp. sativus]|uniref:Uncharacterized protein n=1 Tax=Daucus carota subsp. sativus TaxID=79200 RepID=A0A175YCJ3_DAUCS|nr:hypothetical protein DCAR_0414515 [Daucus carota subsp. sativus]
MMNTVVVINKPCNVQRGLNRMPVGDLLVVFEGGVAATISGGSTNPCAFEVELLFMVCERWLELLKKKWLKMQAYVRKPLKH